MYSHIPKAVRQSLFLNPARWSAAVGLAVLCTGCPTGEPVCGDGIVDAVEECDDGNPYGGDGCDAQCAIEEGYACAASGSEPCTPASVCGDGILTSNEECDDGELNGTGYNKCTPQCTLGPYCGDGVVYPEIEQCDDGVNDGTGSGACYPGCVRN